MSQYSLPPYIEEMFKLELSDRDITVLKETLSELRKPVAIKLFTTNDRMSCFSCRETEKLLTLLQTVSPSIGDKPAINLDIIDIVKSSEIAKKISYNFV